MRSCCLPCSSRTALQSALPTTVRWWSRCRQPWRSSSLCATGAHLRCSQGVCVLACGTDYWNGSTPRRLGTQRWVVLARHDSSGRWGSGRAEEDMLCPGSPRGTVAASPSSACGARARCHQARPFSLSHECVEVNPTRPTGLTEPLLDVYPGMPDATFHRGQEVDDGWQMSALGRPCTRRFDRDDGILRELSLGFGVCRTHGMHTVEWHQAIAATILGCKATTSLAQLGAQKCVPCWEGDVLALR